MSGDNLTGSKPPKASWDAAFGPGRSEWLPAGGSLRGARGSGSVHAAHRCAPYLRARRALRTGGLKARGVMPCSNDRKCRKILTSEADRMSGAVWRQPLTSRQEQVRCRSRKGTRGQVLRG